MPANAIDKPAAARALNDLALALQLPQPFPSSPAHPVQAIADLSAKIFKLSDLLKKLPSASAPDPAHAAILADTARRELVLSGTLREMEATEAEQHQQVLRLMAEESVAQERRNAEIVKAVQMVGEQQRKAAAVLLGLPPVQAQQGGSAGEAWAGRYRSWIEEDKRERPERRVAWWGDVEDALKTIRP